MDQWDRIESSEINSYIYSKVIFSMSFISIYLGKNFLFNRWCWDHWIFPCKWMNLDPYITPWTKINSKWISDLNVKGWNHKILTGKCCKSSWPWICSGFLYTTSKAQLGREKMHKLDFIKTKNFCASMGIVKKIKRKPKEWEENICKSYNW